jgi:hypothetical protein
MYSTSLSSIDARFRMRQAAVALLVILCSLPIQLTAQSTPPREGSPASNKRVNVSSVSVNSDGLLFVNYEGLEIPAGSFARVGFFKPASSSSATKAVK